MLYVNGIQQLRWPVILEKKKNSSLASKLIYIKRWLRPRHDWNSVDGPVKLQYKQTNTTTTTPTTTTTTTNLSVGLTCLHCVDLPVPRDCGKVKHCGSHEVHVIII